MKISCLILVLACTHWALAAKRASTSSSNRARSTTVSSILPDEWRDPYMYSLFEMTLSTIDSKLRKIENLDRAVELLTQRLDSIDRRLSDSTSKVDVSLSMLQNIEARLAESSQIPETYAESLEPQILALDEKISNIGSKLNVLAYQLDSNTLSWSSQNDSEPYGADASEQSKTFTVPTVPETPKTFDDSENIRMSISSVDRHLKVLIELFSEQMDKMFQTVNDIRSSLMGQEFHEATSTTPTPSTEAPFNTSSRVPNKLDALYQKMSPLLGVSEKMDEVWNVLVGTKSSVDTLVPTSEALLWQTQRQERAISSIHNDLNVKTEQIIGNLNLMERYLAQQKEIKSQAKQLVTTESVSDIRPRAAESQIRLTYKPNSTNSAARENRLQHDPPSTPNKSTVDEAAIALPTDIMDSEFLHDDPEVQGAKASNTTKASSSQISPLAATTTRYPVPAGPTERSRVPTHSSVIFPSVKNKPGFSNSTFFYNYTKPQNIRGHSCAELKEQGLSESGIYYLLIPGTTFWYLKVYCDMETANGGWTVIQRRDDFDEPRENFNRDWDDYKNGFGDTEAEFWLGNENIYMLTNAEDYSLRVDLEDFEGNKRYAEYSSFKLHSEREQYKLEIGGYTGDAGDSLNDPWYGSNLSPFSTYNRDNDRSSLNCASMLKGGWWWKSCGRGLNGIYLTDPQDLTARQGIVWFRWRGWDYTLKRATMMIRPRHYAKDPSTPAP